MTSAPPAPASDGPAGTLDPASSMLALHDVRLAYSTGDSTVTVLDGLELDVARGERVAITGPSGSGKTSLLLVLTGLEEADSGTVRIDGRSLDAMDRDARADLRRESIGIVFQSFHLIPTLTARENVALALEIGGLPDARARATRMLERVGLAERATHYPSELSGGEQQRVAIARALVHEPALVVADEPTGNLDADTGRTIVELLFELERETGATLLLVTHDPGLAARCDRTLRLQGGRLGAVGARDAATAAAPGATIRTNAPSNPTEDASAASSARRPAAAGGRA